MCSFLADQLAVLQSVSKAIEHSRALGHRTARGQCEAAIRSQTVTVAHYLHDHAEHTAVRCNTQIHKQCLHRPIILPLTLQPKAQLRVRPEQTSVSGNRCLMRHVANPQRPDNVVSFPTIPAARMTSGEQASPGGRRAGLHLWPRLHDCDGAIRPDNSLDVLWAAHALLCRDADLTDTAQQLLPAPTGTQSQRAAACEAAALRDRNRSTPTGSGSVAAPQLPLAKLPNSMACWTT